MALGTHPRARAAGIIGGLVGLAAAGTAVGVGVSRAARRGCGPPSSVRPPRCPSPPPPNCARTTRSARIRGGRPHRAGAGRRRRPPRGRGDRPARRPADCRLRARLHAVDGLLDVPAAHLAASLATANGTGPRPGWSSTTSAATGLGPGGPERSTIEQLGRDLAVVLEDAGAERPGGPGGPLHGRHDDHGAGGAEAGALRLPDHRRGADLHLERTAGRPELRPPRALTRVRAAVFPVAAWTMRRRPAFAERTRRLAADLVSVVTRRCPSPRPTSTRRWALRGRDDRRTPVDVIAEFYPALAGLDETGSLDPLRGSPRWC